MEQKVKELLDLLIKGVKQGADTVGEQLPDLMNEIVMWGVYYHGLLLLLSIIGIALFLSLWRMLYNAGQKAMSQQKDNYFAEYKSTEEYEFQDSVVPVIIIMIIILIASVITFGVNIHNFIQALVAPKLYILEYAKDFL